MSYQLVCDGCHTLIDTRDDIGQATLTMDRRGAHLGFPREVNLCGKCARIVFMLIKQKAVPA